MEYRPDRNKQKHLRKQRAKQIIRTNLLCIIVALIVGVIIVVLLMLVR